MRTKALLGMAALAAGALTSMAQSNVYSLNVVGYYNVTATVGYVLTANQLDNGTNGLNQVLPTAGAGDQVLTFANNAFTTDITDGTGNWFDNNTGNPTTTTIPPGKGFYYLNAQASPETVTFVGQVRQGALSTVYGVGYTLVSTPIPVALGLNSNNFPQVPGMLGLTFANNAFTTLINDGGPAAGGMGWLDNNTGNPVNFAPAIGQGYYIQNPNATPTNWSLNFTVQ
jgi:hypothetical protein